MNITAKVIQDSTSLKSVRLLTFELEYPRFIHSEVMTHRMLSKNAASSRAIPVERMLANIKENTAMPVFWGKNKPGMQANEEVDNVSEAKIAWGIARDDAIQSAINLHDRKGLHKQISNRVTEAFQMMKTVISGTEWTNLLWLRNHPDAQPEFRVLAEEIQKAMNNSLSRVTYPGEWHVPYVTRTFDNDGRIVYSVEGQTLSQEEAIMVSASCCAQVSYRRLDDTLEKAKAIYDRLVNPSGGPVHASPLEHQATPMHLEASLYDEGSTHMRKDGSIWSGNFKGWIQHRQLVKGHTKW